jgi:hypothetical protein
MLFVRPGWGGKSGHLGQRAYLPGRAFCDVNDLYRALLCHRADEEEWRSVCIEMSRFLGTLETK